MADWTRGMRRTYEFWRVNPDTWGDSERIESVTACSVTRDADDPVLGGATFSMDAWEGEMYVREYLVTYQFGLRERWPLGVHLLQASDWDFNGMRGTTDIQASTPLKELQDDAPPIGFFINSGNTSAQGARLMSTYGRMPVNTPADGMPITNAIVASDSDSWLSYISTVLAKGGEEIALDSRGAAHIVPQRNPRALRPAMTFDDSNSSILHPDVKVASNISTVPNVIEVVYSTETGVMTETLVNSDASSESSTVTRGRRVLHRNTSPSLPDNPTRDDVAAAAAMLMKGLGHGEYEVTFTHGFVPDVTVGTAVRLNYRRMGLNVVAMVVRQVIDCTPSCPVTTTARYRKES